MCSNYCFWFLGILVFALLGCCCCMGIRLGKYACKCGRCIYYCRKDTSCCGDEAQSGKQTDLDKE